MKSKEVLKIVKTNSLILLNVKFNNVNFNDKNIIAINLKISIFSFLKIVKIEFKMTLQSFFLFGILHSARKT